MTILKKAAFAAAIVSSMMAGASFAATVSIENGSFEQPGTFTGSFQTVAPGSNTLTGWTIGMGGVDHIRTYWDASDGGYSLDMNAGTAGSISQQVNNLVTGELYQINFDMAANPDRGPLIKSLVAAIDGFSDTFTFDGTGKDRTNMGWELRSFYFRATSTSEELSFTGVEPALWGAALDNIWIRHVSPVPVPASLLLFGTAIGALGLVRSKKRKPSRG